MRYGLIAKKLGHSFSPQLHQMIGGYKYDLIEVPETDLAAFLTSRDFDGINVTIPYKEAVLPYLDEIDTTAASIGAVNTIVNRQGKLTGYNTDLGGMLAQIHHMELQLYGKKVLILGTGGTAKTARAAAQQLGAAEICFVSRTGRDGAITYNEAISHHADTGILINATPCGMYPDLDGCPISLTHFPDLCGVFDVVYNPLFTRLVLAARQRGIPAEGGLYMLVAQAILASELFTGNCYEKSIIDRIYARLLQMRRNLVLIGMPGCGKSTVGREAARLMSRDFCDLDEIITQRAGKTIPEIFAQIGETGFRELESSVIRDFSGQTGLVIATGGGCILRQENVDRLRQNGCLFLLNRPLEQLFPTKDRPLSNNYEKLRVLYQQRIPLYCDAADEVIPTENGAAATAQTAVQRFGEVICP